MPCASASWRGSRPVGPWTRARGGGPPAVAIDPTRLGAGGLRLQLELALLEPAIARATAAPAHAPPRPSRPRPRLPVRARRRGPSSPPTPPPSPSRLPRGHVSPAARMRRPPARLSRRIRRKKPSTAPWRPGPSPSRPRPYQPASRLPVSEARRPPPSADPPPTTSSACATAGPGLVEQITQINRAVKPLIVDCRPIGVEGNVVTLGFPEEKAFLKDVAERRRPILEQAFSQYLDHPVGVRCVATNLDLVPPLPADADAAHILAEAHRIFADDLADTPEVT